MTVEITLLPDGQSKIPTELMDDEILAAYLKKLNVPQQTPIDSWKDIRRVKRGESMLTLRVKGIMLSDVPDTLLDQALQTITKPTTGVKPHQNGWIEYDESEDNLPANTEQ